MNATVELDNASSMNEIPPQESFSRWVNATLKAAGETIAKPLTLGIRIVDEAESMALNNAYRGKNYPTNVLSFGSDIPDFALAEMEEVPAGDLAICAAVVAREALEQGKSQEAHWAHMVVHGLLHLRGFDHESDEQADTMERLEVRILQNLGFDDPYQTTDPCQSTPPLSNNGKDIEISHE